MAVRRRVLGPEHPDTMMTIINLAGMLRMAGRLDEASALYSDSFEEMVGLVPGGHPLLQTLRVNMAQLARSRGDLLRADQVLSEVFEERLASHGIENERTVRVLFELTSLAQQRSEFTLAEDRALRGLDGSSASPGPPTHDLYLFQQELGRIWTAMGLFGDAEETLLESLDSFEAIKDRLDRTPRPEPALVELYRSWGKPQLAAEYSGG